MDAKMMWRPWDALTELKQTIRSGGVEVRDSQKMTTRWVRNQRLLTILVSKHGEKANMISEHWLSNLHLVKWAFSAARGTVALS